VRQPGDAVAWKQFVHLYTPLLYYWARHRLGLQSADAADLVQEVFLGLCHALPNFKYDRQRSFRAFLFTLMRNKWQDWRRRRVPVPVGSIDPALAERAEDGPAALEEAEYRSHICARALRLIQSEFSPVTWRTFWATVVEGRSAVDAAREFGVTANAVYLARGRVLRRLREELDGLME